MTHTTVGLLVTLILSLFMAPLTAEAQTPAPIPRIGIISGEPEDSPIWEAFRVPGGAFGDSYSPTGTFL